MTADAPPSLYLKRLQADARAGQGFHWQECLELRALSTQLTGRPPGAFQLVQILADFTGHFTAALLGAEETVLSRQQFEAATPARASVLPQTVKPTWFEFAGLRGFGGINGTLLFAVPQHTPLFGVPLGDGVLFLVQLGGQADYNVSFVHMQGNTIMPSELQSAPAVQQMMALGHSRGESIGQHARGMQLLRALLACAAGDDAA